MTISSIDSHAVGVGLRQPHYHELLEMRPGLGLQAKGSDRALGFGETDGFALGFLEVHSENFFADGGAALAVLRQARESYAISLHGVGLSLGSAIGLDPWHLDQLARLVERIEPARVSDHASFARAPRRGTQVSHMNDLLPIAFTPASLDILATNVAQVQDRLKRPILVENLSAYFHWADDALPEPEFFNALARRTGCGVLLDVNNLVVNALNAGDDDPAQAACAWIDALAPGLAGEIHLAGYAELGDIVIDDHGSRVHAPVWQVYRHAIARLGPVPTLIEWDTDIPPLAVLLDEAREAARVCSASMLELVSEGAAA